MVEERTVSRASTIVRNSFAESCLVHGFSCWRCGKWLAIDPIVMPMPDKPPPSTNLYEINPIVVKYFDSIKRLKDNGATWASVKRLLSVGCEVQLSEKTLRVHYMRLCDAE
jgi:hypothetical protein